MTDDAMSLAAEVAAVLNSHGHITGGYMDELIDHELPSPENALIFGLHHVAADAMEISTDLHRRLTAWASSLSEDRWSSHRHRYLEALGDIEPGHVRRHG